MRKRVFLAAVLLVAFAVALAFAQEKQEKEMKMEKKDPAAELKASVKRGEALFNDAELGTTGLTCGSCHMKGGTVDGKMGDMTMKAFDVLNTKYPRYVSMMGQIDKVITLDQMVNFCVVNPLKGEALAADDQRLADLVAYCSSVRPAPPEEKKEK